MNVTVYGYDAYVLYYRRNGEKLAVLCNGKAEVARKRQELKKQRRKFLGYRPVKLYEISNGSTSL